MFLGRYSLGFGWNNIHRSFLRKQESIDISKVRFYLRYRTTQLKNLKQRDYLEYKKFICTANFSTTDEE